MGQPEQSAGASGQTREKKSRRSRKKGQKPAEKTSDRQDAPENEWGADAAPAGANATKGRRRKDKAGATKGQVGQQVSAGKSAEAPRQDGDTQRFDGPGHLGKERNGADHGGYTEPAPHGEGAPGRGEGTAPAAEGDSGQHDKVGPDQKRRRNKKSKESKLLVYRRLGEYMAEEDEKKVEEVLAKKGVTEIDDKSNMAAGVDGRGDVADVVQSPAAPPTGALATDGDGEGEDTYYSILAQIQETVEQAAETLNDPTAEGEVEVEDSPSSFEDILKFAAAMEESDDTTTSQDESQPPTPATTDADGLPQVQGIPEVPTSRIATTGTGEVSSSSSSHPKDSIDVDMAISHVAEKESKVPNAGEDMEDDAKVQDAGTPEDMSSDRGDPAPQTEVNVNGTGVTENEPKSTEELHSAGSSVGMEEGCEESNIPAPPESSTSEVTEINTVEPVTPEQDTSGDEPLPAPGAENPGKEADGGVSGTTDTDATTPAVEVTPVISTAEAATDPVTPAKSEDDKTEAVNEEDLLLNAEEGEAIAINLPRHLSEEVRDTATESDMGNKSAKPSPDDEQAASKQDAVDDDTEVFGDAVADTSTMPPDNQSDLPNDVPANPIQTSEDEIEVELEVTVPNESPDSQDAEEDQTEVPNYTPPPPTPDSTDPAIPAEEKAAQPKQETTIVIGKVSTLPDDIPYIDDVDEPVEETDTEVYPVRINETTPLNAAEENAPVEIPKVASAEEEPLIVSPEPTRDEPSTTPEEKPKKKKKRSKLFSCMFPCVQPPKEKNH